VEAIKSVTAQTWKDLEIIVVDDGSDDNTADIIKNIDDRITYIFQNQQGVSAARNRGIRTAAGDYVAFLDSDDLWQPKKLDTQLGYLKQNPFHLLVHTDEIWIRNNRRVNPRNIHRKYGGWIFSKCLPLCCISPSSVLIRKSLFRYAGLFDINLPACEDYDFWLRVTSLFPAGYISKQLTVKRGGHADQLSQKHWGMDRFRIYSILKLLERDCLSYRQREAAVDREKNGTSISVYPQEKMYDYDKWSGKTR